MKNLYEYNDYFKQFTSISDEELMEMANISSKKTGLLDIYIWVGPNPKYHGKRIKVSNIPNKFSKDDCFTLTIPNFEIVGNINTKLIDSKKLSKIIEFVEINMKLICDFSDEIISTDELIENLIPIIE